MSDIATANRSALRGGTDAAPDDDAGALDADGLRRTRREAAHFEHECRFHAAAHSRARMARERRTLRIGAAVAVLGGLAGGGIASFFGGAGPGSLAAVAAVVAGLVCAAVRVLHQRRRAALHGAAGMRYRALAEEARRVRAACASGDVTAPGTLLPRLQALVERAAEIGAAAPTISEHAVVATRARTGGDAWLARLAVDRERPPSG